MEVTHYFLHTDYATTLKNNLQKEFYKFLKELSGTVIFASDFEKVKKLILDKVAELNATHKQCKPMVCSFGNNFDREDSNRLRLDGFYAANFYIYKGKFTTISL